jgi:hypothetical protein
MTQEPVHVAEGANSKEHQRARELSLQRSVNELCRFVVPLIHSMEKLPVASTLTLSVVYLVNVRALIVPSIGLDPVVVNGVVVFPVTVDAVHVLAKAPDVRGSSAEVPGS